MLNNLIAITVLLLLAALTIRTLWRLVQKLIHKKTNKQNAASGGCSHCH